MTTETPAELNPANIEASLTAANEVQKKIIEIETGFREIETFIIAARQFLMQNADKLNGIAFRCYGWSKQIVFNTWGDVTEPKEIARRFGADGWTREHDSHTCGAVHWLKTVDGIQLRVENAETIKPTLNQNVRL